MGNKFYGVYTASRDQNDGSLGRPKRMGGNTKFHDGPAIYCPVNNVVYFTRNNYVGKKKIYGKDDVMRLKIFRAELDSKGRLTNVMELTINGDNFSTGHPAISKDGKTLFFSSDRPGGFGGADIWKVSIDASGTTGTPENLGNTVNTSQNEMFPYVEGENNMLFFASDGHTGLGGLDIFYGYMNPSQTAISGLTNMGTPVNGQYDDFGFIIDKSLQSGYFISNRTEGQGDDDVYSFKMLKNFSPSLSVEGLVADCDDKSRLLPGSMVYLKDKDGNDITSTKVGDDGYYRFLLDPAVKTDYYVEGTRMSYEKAMEKFSTANLPENTRVIEKDLCLKPIAGVDGAGELALLVLVIDKETKQPIEGARLRTVDMVTTRQIIDVTTPKTGDHLRPLQKTILDDLIFRVRADKDGYKPSIVDYASVYETPGVIRIVVEMEKGKEDGPIGPTIIGCDGEPVVLKPIYFDLDKHFIREDAKVELDKIVALLNRCPEMRMEIGSHTDCRHSMAYNDALSNRRAQATLAYIRPRISNPSRLTAKGYGERQLAVDCPCEPSNESSCSEEQHQLNRRTEFKILSVGGKRADNGALEQNNDRAEQSTTDNTNQVYVVQPNDNLYNIALKHGTTVENIIELNGLKSETIQPGQTLRIA
jgi:outer membrane protein OmpA-like peptidoglycan-associated protein